MEIIKILNPENVSEQEVTQFEAREAVRAVVCDNDGNVAILNVSKQNYHKLPGGGVKKGENLHDALKRECREELGCGVKIYGEVGQIIEYRKMYRLKQISTCYLAKVMGEKGNPSYTQEESEDGFQIQWVSIGKAIELMNKDKPLNDEGRLYIVPRDKIFLAKCRSILG